MVEIEKLKIPCTGYSVVADWYKGRDESRILLVLIGYISSKANQKNLITALVKQTGMCALVFDFSGMGDSPFEIENISPAQHFLETVHAFDWIRQKYPNSDISVLGGSYGGYLATQLTKYREFPKLVLRAPAIYPPRTFYDLMPQVHAEANRDIRRDSKALASHPLLTRASKFKGKTLVVVHGRDDVIPRETTDAYIKAFNADVYIQHEFVHSLRDPSNPKDKFVEYEKHISNWLMK